MIRFSPFVCAAFPAAMLLVTSGRVLAQQGTPPDSLATRIVVTGNPVDPLAPDAAAARERLATQPVAANVVTDDDYQLGRRDYLDDFLRYQPGLVIESGQGTEATHVSSRGSGQDNDDIIGLALMIDGIPLNQADGEAFPQDIDLQTIKYTEVYRGADALRYGAVTLGGAINFVSLTGQDAPPLAVGISFGSYGYTQQQASSGWSQGPWDAFVAFSNHTLDGYQEHSAENYQKVTANLGYRINDRAEDRLYFYYGRLDQENPGSLTKDDLYANPRQAGDDAVEEDFATKWDYYRLLDRFALRGDDWTLQAAVQWNHRQELQSDEFQDDFRLGTVRFYSDDYSADAAFESTAEWFGQRNRFTVGSVPFFEPESDSFHANPDGKIGALLFTDRTYYLNVPVFLENQHWFTRRFSLLTGGQAVYVDRIFLDGYKSATLGDQTHRDHYWAVNPKVGLAYQWNDKDIVFLNASRSFQPPSFDESLGIVEGVDGGQAFHELESQKGITLEVGTRGEAGPLQWDFVLYRTWLRDELIALNNAEGVPLGTVNARKTVHEGIEAGLETTLVDGLLVRGVPADDVERSGKEVAKPAPGKTHRSDRIVIEQTYNLQDFRFSDDAVYGNKRIAGNPVQSYKAEIRYEHPCGLYVGPNVEWNILKYPVDEQNSLFADPYALLGVRAGYKTGHGFEVYFEVKNLLAKTYAAYVEPIADARSGDDTDSFSPGVGRAFYGGVSWSW